MNKKESFRGFWKVARKEFRVSQKKLLEPTALETCKNTS